MILHAVGEYDLSLRFLEHALTLNIKYFGSKSLKVAVSYHLVARTQSCQGDFRSALSNEKETYAIYRSTLGEEHEKTKESSECLRHLTHQAVVMQKRMKELCRSGSGASSAVIPPIQIQSPSMAAVLDMLNIINGILFVQVTRTAPGASNEGEGNEVETSTSGQVNGNENEEKDLTSELNGGDSLQNLPENNDGSVLTSGSKAEIVAQ